MTSPPSLTPSSVRPKADTLARKLLILGALPAVLMFVVLMLFFTYARLQDASQQVADHSQIIVDSLAPALEYAVLSGNASAINEIIFESLKRSHADWIRVTNLRQEVIGFVSHALGADLRLKQAEVEARLATMAESALKNNIFTAEILKKPLNMDDSDTPVWFDPSLSFVGGALRVGSVHVGFDPDLLASKRRDIVWTSLALGVVLLLVTMVMVNYFLAGILRPMRNIALRIDALSGRDYSLKPVNQYRNSQELISIEIRLNELAQHLEELQALQEQALTQTRLALEQAEHDSQAKSEFMAIVSHELQTPLQAVLTTIKLVERESLSDSQSKNLNTANGAAQDLLLVINDILDYSRLDRGTAVLRSYPFDLRSLIHNCVASHGQLAQDAGLTLDLHFHQSFPDIAMVHGDAPKLRQIVAGLLDCSINGCHDGRVQIEARLKAIDTAQLPDNQGTENSSSSKVLLSFAVSDAAAKNSPHLLSINYGRLEQDGDSGQATAGHNPAFMGLSLPLVQRLIELMGGHLKVQANAHNHSTLHCEIPFEQ